MIKGVWIIHKDGKCLFHREYENLNINEQLFSGFLVALLAFSKEISNQELKSINLENLIFYYRKTEDTNIIFVIAADSKERPSKISDKSNLIEKAFFNEYKDILPQWTGNISDFSKFDVELDNILNNEGKIITLFDFNPLNKASFENLFKKIMSICGKKDEKELDELDHTLEIIEDITDRKEKFCPPQFLIDSLQKMRLSLKRLFHKQE